MRLFRLFFIVVAALILSACSSDFFSITPKEDREKAKQEKAKKDRTAAISQPAASASGDITAPPIIDNTSLNKPVVNNPPLPVIDPSLDVNISEQDAEKFQEWKRSRTSSSNDYREFREYQDWLEFKKLNEQYK